MRLQNADRALWIDALCINQDDTTERGHQVGVMHKIYSNNQENLVWLGDDDGTTACVWELIDTILQNAREETDDFKCLRQTLRDSDGGLRVSSHGIDLRQNHEPLLSLYSRPWFQRLWVSSFLGSDSCTSPLKMNPGYTRSCIVSHQHMLLFSLRKAPRRYTEGCRVVILQSRLFALQSRRCTRHMESRRFVRFRRPGFWPLATSSLRLVTFQQLIFNLGDLETSDPKDSVYGLLGLYQDLKQTETLPELLYPNYEKSVEEILRDATRIAMLESRSLSLFHNLNLRGFGRAAMPSLPSWTPYWQQSFDRKHHPSGLEGFFKADDKVALSLSTIDGTQVSDLLSVIGFTADTVRVASSALTYESAHCVQTTIRHINEVESMIKRHIGFIDVTSLGECLIAGKNSCGQRATEEDCLGFTLWHEYSKERGEYPRPLRKFAALPQKLPDETWKASRYDAAFHYSSRNRRFFVTNTGMMGLGSQIVKSNDVVAILYGCRWPVILRPRGERYEVIGVCYVQGIMFGEAVREHKADGKEDQVFVLE